MVDRYSSWVSRKASKTCTTDAGPEGKDGLDGTGLEDPAEDVKDPEELLLLTDAPCLCLGVRTACSKGLSCTTFRADVARCWTTGIRDSEDVGESYVRGVRGLRSPVLRARAACFIGVG